MALVQTSSVGTGTGEAGVDPVILTLNSVTAGNAVIIQVVQLGSLIRSVKVGDNIVGADAYTPVVSFNPSRGAYILIYKNHPGGNLTIEVTLSSSAGSLQAVAQEVSGLDNSASAITSTFGDTGNSNSHPCAASGEIDTAGPCFIVAPGSNNSSSGVTSITAATNFTGIALTPLRGIFQYWDAASAVTDERASWNSTGTARISYCCIAAFPLASAGGQTLEFSGSIPLPELDVTLTASAELQFSGSIPLPELSAQLNSTLQLSFNGSIPLPEFAALLDANADLNAALSIPLPSLSAVLSQVNTETLVFNGSIPLPTISAALAAHAELSGSFSIPLPTISASLLNGAPDNFQALYKLWNFRARLDVKLEIDSGNIEADELDVGGTFVAFNKAFKDINSITVSALSTTEIVAIYDFVDVPNPTGFYVYAFDTAGSRVTATVSWKARGVL